MQVGHWVDEVYAALQSAFTSPRLIMSDASKSGSQDETALELDARSGMPPFLQYNIDRLQALVRTQRPKP